MSCLVDTNVFSEPVKPKPDASVVAWLRRHQARDSQAGKLFGVFQRLHSEREFSRERRRDCARPADCAAARLGAAGRGWAEGGAGRGATFYFTMPNRKP